MRQDAHELVNEIFMSTSFSAHLIVEGDADYSLIRQHILKKNSLNVLPAHGSEHVLSCLVAFDIANATVGNKVRKHAHFFIDADYRQTLGNIPNNKLLTTTTLKDIECEMINSAAFDTVAMDLICPLKLIKKKISISDHKNLIIDAAKKIGALRFASEKASQKMSFSDLRPTKFFNSETLRINEFQLADHLRGKNKALTINASSIAKNILETSKIPHFSNPLNLCSGHDLTMLFSAALKFWKTKNHPAACETPDIEFALRLSFKDCFRSTECYKSIYSWYATAAGDKFSLSSPI